MCVFISWLISTQTYLFYKYSYILLCYEKSPRSVHLSRHGSSVSVSATLVPHSLRGRRPVVPGIPSEYIHICTHICMHVYTCMICMYRVCARAMYLSLSPSFSLDLMPVRARAFEHTTRRVCCEGRSVCSPRSPRKDNRCPFCPIPNRDVSFNWLSIGE